MDHQEKLDFLAGDGEMAELIRAKNWSETPLGPVERWPQSLRTTVSLCLASNFPINIIWGPENTQIYNDGYRVICGESHPRALGEGYHITWASAWPAIGEPSARALSGETSYLENQRMFLTRNGYLEETFFTFSISPIRDESGGIGGLFHPVIETTATILAERRTRALRDLTSVLGGVTDMAELAKLVVDMLARFDLDLPFVLVYALAANDTRYCLAAHYGLGPGTGASPRTLDVDATAPWPIAEAVGGLRIVEVNDVALITQNAPCGPYEEAPDRALILPVSVPGVDHPPIIAVVGASPRLPLDDVYRGFYELLAATLSAALATVRAREDECRRAEALAEIDRAKTTFFSNVSHEFRTPLTLMLGPLEDLLARAGGLPDDDRERVALAYRNSLRLLKLVNSLLDFSRMETGRVRASYEPTDIAAFTADLALNFRSACERAALALVIDAPPLPELVYLDREMWEKVVLNLLSNAFKFTLKGEIRVLVRPSAEGDAAEVTVSDTGAGIPAEDLPRVFERFHRVEAAHGRSFEGSGIGLALVQEMVKLHGGKICVTSELGRGSAFTLTIPFGHTHVAADRLGPAAPIASTATRASVVVQEAMQWLPDDGSSAAGSAAEVPRLAGKATYAHAPGSSGRILLADDNADMRSYVERLLMAEGFAVELVTDGEAALASARRAAPELILSDVMMPRLDGFGLLRALRDDPALHDVPFVLLSARAGEEARIEGLEAGADDYLTKPFAARELVARISATLNLARDRREAALRQSEARLRELNATLEQRVAERTRQLEEQQREREAAEEQLRQSQKMEAVGQLTGGLAHDFNNLLTGITGSLELLGTRIAQGRIKDLDRYVNAAQGAAKRAAGLTHRLLAFSRRQTLDPKPTDVNRLVAGMEELIRRTMGPAIEVETVAAGGLWSTLVDPGQLENALLNLCINARDAMPDGGKLTIETGNKWLDARAAVERDLPPGQYVALCVSDDGIGMPPDVTARAFDPFFTTKPIGQGTGLGLSMIYGFVRQSGGQVRIYSEVGQGTMVCLYMPRHQGASEELHLPAEQSEAPRAEWDETVLIVDDEPTIRMLVAEVLEDLGYTAIEAADGASGLKLLQSNTRIDLLVTDVGLPGGMNGRQLADAARVARPNLKVLFITGYAENAALRHGHLAPGMHVMTKPFAMDALASRIKELIAGPGKTSL